MKSCKSEQTTDLKILRNYDCFYNVMILWLYFLIKNYYLKIHIKIFTDVIM